MKQDNFSHSQLRFDTEKHLSSDSIMINKVDLFYHNTDEHIWVIDINDDCYIYYSEAERDKDYSIAINQFKKEVQDEV